MKKKALILISSLFLTFLLGFSLVNLFAAEGKCYGNNTLTHYPSDFTGMLRTFDCTVDNIVWHDLECCDEGYPALSCAGRTLYKCKAIAIPD